MIASPLMNRPIDDYVLMPLLEDDCELLPYLNNGYYLYGFPVVHDGGLYQTLIKYKEEEK